MILLYSVIMTFLFISKVMENFLYGEILIFKVKRLADNMTDLKNNCKCL